MTKFIRVSEYSWHFYRKQLGLSHRYTIECQERDTYEKFLDNPPIFIDKVQGFRVDGVLSFYFLAPSTAIDADVAKYNLHFPSGADTVEIYASDDVQL